MELNLMKRCVSIQNSGTEGPGFFKNNTFQNMVACRPLCVFVRRSWQYIKMCFSLFSHPFLYNMFLLGVTIFLYFLKRTVHTKKKTLSLFTHPHVVSKPHASICFCVTQKQKAIWYLIRAYGSLNKRNIMDRHNGK